MQMTSSGNQNEYSKKRLENNCKILSNYFYRHSLQLNTKQTEFTFSAEKHRETVGKKSITLDKNI